MLRPVFIYSISLLPAAAKQVGLVISSIDKELRAIYFHFECLLMGLSYACDYSFTWLGGTGYKTEPECHFTLYINDKALLTLLVRYFFNMVIVSAKKLASGNGHKKP
jgi:hypothetical protein